jgi:hypothetical protein
MEMGQAQAQDQVLVQVLEQVQVLEKVPQKQEEQSHHLGRHWAQKLRHERGNTWPHRM